MRNNLDSPMFLEYGTVYASMDPQLRSAMNCHSRRVKGRRLQELFFRFDCEAYIEIQSGVGILLASHDPHTMPVAEFVINRRFCMRPGIYFSIVSNSPEIQVELFLPQKYAMDLAALSLPYECRTMCPRIRVTEILGYFYKIRNAGDTLPEREEPFYELIYVDTGALRTQVDGKTYEIREKEIMIYGPGQRRSQAVSGNGMVTYVTVQFRATDLGNAGKEDWSRQLLNKVLPYNKKIYYLIKNLVQESSGGVPYMESLMECILTQILIRLLQAEYVEPNAGAGSIVRQNYQDELFGRIVAYIEKRIYEPLTVADICQEFSLSRSSMQLLFNNAVNRSPKRYISDLKLETGCRLLRENKYTVSEIAQKLGYSSIHYFSNAFHRKYHISPSEYAKRIY